MAVSNFNRWRTAVVAALSAVAVTFTATACAADEGDEQDPTMIEDEQEGENGEGDNNGEGENGEDGENGNGGQSG